ncbi:MAG: ATP-grasp domain-containing protein [Chthoniobacterales bacterium]
MTHKQLPIAVYYEHQDWFRPLFAELDRRHIAYVRVDARCHSYDVHSTTKEFSVFFNRMSASAYLRGNVQGIFFTLNYLAHLEKTETRVINGSEAFALEISKAAQLSLLQSLGVACPRSRVINCVDETQRTAAELGFPLVVKPNTGGRGAGIVRLNSTADLERAFSQGQINLGIDHTAVVQEFIPARGGHIVRVETLGGKFLYAIKVFISDNNFNYCPAELCRTEDATACLIDAPKTGLKVEPFNPAPNVIDAVEEIVGAAGIDVGGVEYIVDDRDGRLLFYDINALSNFIADAPRILGFDPHARLVDYLEQERV